MTFDELNKFDLGYNGFTDFEAGASSRQAEIDELKAELEREKQRTTDNYDACDDIVKMSDDIVKGLEAENDALQKQIDLIVDLVRNQTIDYFLDNLIQDILKGGD